jgi:glycosyltransferase involved in cell wall biosynthesis
VSSSEGVPVSIMEAFSYGIPVIATAVDGNPEIVEDGYNGFLLSANPCKEDVIQCIQRFMAMDGAEKHRLAENARNTWNEKYNAEVNFSRFAKELLEISRLNS